MSILNICINLNKDRLPNNITEQHLSCPTLVCSLYCSQSFETLIFECVRFIKPCLNLSVARHGTLDKISTRQTSPQGRPCCLPPPSSQLSNIGIWGLPEDLCTYFPFCPECCSPSPLGLIPLLFQVKDPALREAFPIQHYSRNELMCHFYLPSFLDYKQREVRQPCYWSVTVPSISEILNF